MYRVLRTWTAKPGAEFPATFQWAAEVTGYINRTYSANLRFGFETFGPATIHWHWESDSLDKIQEFNRKLMQDREYWTIVGKAKGLFLDDKWKDTLINFPD